MTPSLPVLKMAFERRKLTLHYQPMIDLRSHRVFAVEALVRWPDHPDLASRDLITQLEQAGLALPFGHELLKSACRRVKDWHAQGHEDLAVAINLAPSVSGHK